MDTVICSNCWRSEERHITGKCILKMDSDEATVSDWMVFSPIHELDEDIQDWVETPREDDHVGPLNVRLTELMDELSEPSSYEDWSPAGDQVNAPAHYTDGRQYETWDVIVDWKLSYLLGNSIKYISRAGRKGEARQDIQKAIAYLDKYLEGLDD